MKIEHITLLVAGSICAVALTTTALTLQSNDLNNNALKIDTINEQKSSESKWLETVSQANLFDPNRYSFSEEKKILEGNDGNTDQILSSNEQNDNKSWKLVAIKQDQTHQAMIEINGSKFVFLNVGDKTPDGKRITNIDNNQIWLITPQTEKETIVSLFPYK
ncbi:hypothetical protein [Photobacterium leiognathi]|uniref:hypothetical protein n=1 Tax=Photobacterium leiognathi TaxID=553611 RepID=UPI002980D34D|nr:hypothetical protein [Photobacterium leiognathi]